MAPVHVRTGTDMAQSVQLQASRQTPPKVLGMMACSEPFGGPILQRLLWCFHFWVRRLWGSILLREKEISRFRNWNAKLQTPISNETELINASKCVHCTKTFRTLFQTLVSVNYFFFPFCYSRVLSVTSGMSGQICKQCWFFFFPLSTKVLTREERYYVKIQSQHHVFKDTMSLWQKL